MNILIGSRALKEWEPSIELKENSDWDVVSDSPVYGCEFHSKLILNNAQLIEFSSNKIVILPDNSPAHVLNPIGLYVLKRSHLHRDLKFDSHITMFHKHLSKYSKYLDNRAIAFLEERTKLTLEQFPQVKPNLNQSVEDFFDDAVTKKYNHDMLHQLFAYEDEPMYTKLQTNPEKAWCSENLWYTISHQQQLQCVAEETMVIATERFLVPKNWEFPSKLAYMKALKKVCTTLCSGWFRDFAIDHYPEVISLYNPEKFQQVKSNLELFDLVSV